MNASEYLKPARNRSVRRCRSASAIIWFEHRHRPEAKETPSQALGHRDRSRPTPASPTSCGSPDSSCRAARPRRRRPGRLQGHRSLCPRRRHGHRQPGTGAPDGAAAATRSPKTRPARADLAAGARRRPRHRSPDHRRRAGLAAGRADVPDSVNNDDRTRCRRCPASTYTKLKTVATVRISHDDAPDLIGKVRQIPRRSTAPPTWPCPDIANEQSLAQGSDLRPRHIDTKRSCGVAVPRTAIDRLTCRWSRATLK